MAKRPSRRQPAISFRTSWAALRPGDVGRVVRIPANCARLYFGGRGAFGGARLLLEGSDDKKAWRLLHLVPIGPDKMLTRGVRRWVRPLLVGGGADTSVHARLVARVGA